MDGTVMEEEKVSIDWMDEKVDDDDD